MTGGVGNDRGGSGMTEGDLLSGIPEGVLFVGPPLECPFGRRRDNRSG